MLAKWAAIRYENEMPGKAFVSELVKRGIDVMITECTDIALILTPLSKLWERGHSLYSFYQKGGGGAGGGGSELQAGAPTFLSLR
jgi:hypothetical protein